MKKQFWHLYPWQLLTKLTGAKMSCQLESNVDIDRLRCDAEKIIAKFKPVGQHGDDHAGGWKSVSLISYGGDSYESKILKNTPSLKTNALKLAPYMESVIDSFEADKTRVRMMQLLPTENILWHYDPIESLDKGLARIHIPIITNPGVKFQLSHEDCQWKAGEVWYGDFTFPHRLYNGGNEGRIHLVFDIKVNNRLLKLFPKEYIDNSSKRSISRGIIASLIQYYTWPRYKLGYMKKKQKLNDG